jgi:hypothetical protein
MTQQDRRKRSRLGLKLPILLLRTESESPLRTETVDISNDGFYCSTTQPFAPGERLTCVIALPAGSGLSEVGRERLYLHAEVDVVRIVVNNGRGFGIGCRIFGYSVLKYDAIPSWAQAQTEQFAPSQVIEQLG